MTESRKERSNSRWMQTNYVMERVKVLPKMSHRLAVLMMQIDSSQPHLERTYGPYAFQMTAKRLGELMGIREHAAKQLIIELKRIGVLEVLQARYGRQRAVYQLAYWKDRPEPPADPIARAKQQRAAKKRRDEMLQEKRDNLRQVSKTKDHDGTV